jgi:hypothetical protein
VRFSEEFKRLGVDDGTMSGVPPIEEVLAVFAEILNQYLKDQKAGEGLQEDVGVVVSVYEA